MNAFNGAARNNAEPMRFRSLGGWVEQPDDLQPALKGHEHADVVVVGAGFAGLSTALELRARGANVIVLEQQFAGFRGQRAQCRLSARQHGHRMRGFRQTSGA